MSCVRSLWVIPLFPLLRYVMYTHIYLFAYVCVQAYVCLHLLIYAATASLYIDTHSGYGFSYSFSTISSSQIWGAEYQENNAFLVKPEDLPLVLEMGRRENCPVSPVGTVTDDGKVSNRLKHISDSSRNCFSRCSYSYSLNASMSLR